MNIHLKIQELRKKAGLSQEALAEQLGVSRQAVSKWESGASTPDIDKIIALSKLFGISLSELLTGERDDISAESETSAGDEKYEELLQEHLLQIDAMLKGAGRKKRSGWRVFFAVAALFAALCLALSYFDKIQRMENNINNLQNNMSSIRTDINHQIYSIQQEISESLRKEYGLISSSTLDYRDLSLPRRTVVLDISASPRLWNEGDSMSFVVESDGEKLSCEGVYKNGTVYAEIEVPLSDDILVSALITNGGTVKQEQIDELHSLLDMHLLQVDGHGSIHSTHTLGSDKLTMSGSVSVYADVKLDDDVPMSSRIKSAVLEFIENGSVTQTVDLMKDGTVDRGDIENVHIEFDYQIYTIERAMREGDTFEFIATIVDDNGVTYRGVLERIEILEGLEVSHAKPIVGGDFQVTLPEKAE